MSKKSSAADLGLQLTGMLEKAGDATPTLDYIQDIAEALLDTNLLNAKLLIREHWVAIQFNYPKIAFFFMQHGLDEI